MTKIRTLILLTVALFALPVLAGSASAAKTATPSSMSFPATQIDQESATQIVTVSIASTDLGGRFTAPYTTTAGGQPCSPGGFCNFKIVSNGCPVSPATFPAGNQTCTIAVAFTPYDTPGLETGGLEVGAGFPAVALSGTSLNPPRPTVKGKKCKKKGKGKRSASAAKKCGKKK